VYIWTALYLENELKDLKKSILEISDKLNIRCPVKILPMHVSLKMSFDIKDSKADECIMEICDYFSKQAPFSIEPDHYEIFPGILWLKIKDNEKLMEIHSNLDKIIKKHFMVPPSELDKKFKFHTTLFTDTDEKLAAGLKELEKIKLPEKLLARNYIVGTSENGRPDTFSVFRRSHLGPEISIKEEWKEFEGDRPGVAPIK